MKKLIALFCLFNLTCAFAAEKIYECSPDVSATNMVQDFSYTIKEKTILGVVRSVELSDAYNDTWIECEKDYETGHALCDNWIYPYKEANVRFLNTRFHCEKVN